MLLGWVHRVRDLGGVLFIDIRDRAGVSQVVVRDDEKLLAEAKRLRPEYVIAVGGLVERRSAETVNPKLATGEVEVLAREIRLLNEAKTPPFQIAEDSPVSEDVRLRYRYLDLRRPRLQHNLGLRHRVTFAARRYFDAHGFWEIETPILTKSTPEGARDYLVPSRVHPGEFYALPQSPQIFKQILMIAGTDRYFQITRCFRDEDLRADRQPEFTQIDVEMSFATPDLVYGIVEPLIQELFKEIGREIATPVPADAVCRGHRQVRIRQARSALRARDRGPVRRVSRVGVPRVQADRGGRRRHPRVRRAGRQPVHAQPAGRPGRSGEADGIQRPDLGPARRAADQLGQGVERGDASPCSRADRRAVRTTCS